MFKRGLSGQWIPAFSSRRVSTAISLFLWFAALCSVRQFTPNCARRSLHMRSAVSVVVGHSQYAAAVHEHAAIVSRGTCIQPMPARVSADSKDRHLGDFQRFHPHCSCHREAGCIRSPWPYVLRRRAPYRYPAFFASVHTYIHTYIPLVSPVRPTACRLRGSIPYPLPAQAQAQPKHDPTSNVCLPALRPVRITRPHTYGHSN